MKKITFPYFSMIICILFILIGCEESVIVNETDPPNNHPAAPAVVYPPSGALEVSIQTELSWTCSDPDGDSLLYEVYFGTTETPSAVIKDLSSTTHSPDSLTYDQTYYWKVVAIDPQGLSTEGEIWNFTTLINQPPSIPYNPLPPDSSVNQPSFVTLEWSCEDPEDDYLFYDIYFGVEDDPPFAGRNYDGKAFSIRNLELGTTYRWKVIARDEFQNVVESPLWIFSTAADVLVR